MVVRKASLNNVSRNKADFYLFILEFCKNPKVQEKWQFSLILYGSLDKRKNRLLERACQNEYYLDNQCLENLQTPFLFSKGHCWTKCFNVFHLGDNLQKKHGTLVPTRSDATPTSVPISAQSRVATERQTASKGQLFHSPVIGVHCLQKLRWEGQCVAREKKLQSTLKVNYF